MRAASMGLVLVGAMALLSQPGLAAGSSKAPAPLRPPRAEVVVKATRTAPVAPTKAATGASNTEAAETEAAEIGPEAGVTAEPGQETGQEALRPESPQTPKVSSDETRPARVTWTSPRRHEVLFRPGAARLEWKSTFPEGTFYTVTMSFDGRTYQNVVARWQAATDATWTLPARERFDYHLRVKAMDATGKMLGQDVIPVHVVPEDAVVISKENQMLWAFRDGRPQNRFVISTGTQKTETREGWFSVYNRVPNHHSSLYDAPMPFSLFFSGGMAVHASTYTQELGTAASHGCVRLRYDDAKRLYDASPVGRPVIVTAWGEDLSYLNALFDPPPHESRTARGAR